jgi:transcriptional regulator with XRE-family HTH domain
MSDRIPILLPSSVKTLTSFGENIKLARLRRRFTAEQISERASISRSTLYHIEKGSPSVALGLYFQDAGLIVKERGPKRP